MKKFLTFIVLLSHINFSMLLPQTAEQDICDAMGRQTDDINSLYEYIDEVLLGNHDDTPEDEDDDTGQNFLAPKTIEPYLPQSYITYPKTYQTKQICGNQGMDKEGLPLVELEVISPPPKA